MTDNSLAVHRAVVRHGATPLADVADLRIDTGRPLTIVGESGSGKSLLAHALMGTLPPELAVEGSMTIGSTRFDLADRSGRRHLWGRRLAMLPQEPALALDPTMLVRGQVAEGAPGWRPGDVAALRLAHEKLDHLGLAHAGSAYPHTLSGGMAQRVAYAAATIGGARLLIVDEPSKGLDPGSLDRLADLLAAHVADGGLLLTITHDLRLARRLGGDVLVMRDASVVEAGPAERVLTTPSTDYTKRLLAAEPSRWSFPWMANAAAADPTAEPLVAAHGITKSYGDTAVFQDVSLEIRPGERWALTGPSGVGKTTLGNALLRLTSVDRGTVGYGDVTRGRLQKLYQDPALSFPGRVPLERAMRDVMRRHGADEARVRSLLGEVGLPLEILSRRPDQVSGGELQRIAIVRAMLPRPVLIFADEATSRLDLLTQETTMDSLMTEVAGSGCALLLVTHDPDLATAVTDHQVRLGQDRSALLEPAV
ncbi:ATP-binding cassette domain-containing protein [Antribacter sp. KLBMP9083]|uniref:ATP-binding cassette domain-containing protein n=1 Tax=Antribacter soli TaxID=2910976 RepID=A0AA41QDF1_9MICO|nr:ATP-binding cassette domain-containing protein [Antribacter soli]MCF4121398.1 ATP-binding cassette domain-containing protein [Antribacter soli]